MKNSEYDQDILTSHTADTRKTNYTKQPAPAYSSRCLQIENDHKITHTKTYTKTLTDSHNGSNTQQRMNNIRTTTLEQTAV